MLVLAPLLLLTLTGCGVDDIPRFGWPESVTPQGERALDLWRGSSVAALVVGGFVYLLIIWAVIAYRKRDDRIPDQVQYNLPVEVLYTIVPFIIVSFLFYWTARDEEYIAKVTANPDCRVEFVGFQWSWQFNYQDCGEATGLSITGRPGQPPQMFLPTDQKIRIEERSPDVVHSFWVPRFLFKMDVIPGRVNEFEFTVTEPGTFAGRCAELCGLDHSRMLFSVRAAPQDEFDQLVTAAKADTTSGRYSVNGGTPESPGAPEGNG